MISDPIRYIQTLSDPAGLFVQWVPAWAHSFHKTESGVRESDFYHRDPQDGPAILRFDFPDYLRVEYREDNAISRPWGQGPASIQGTLPLCRSDAPEDNLQIRYREHRTRHRLDGPASIHLSSDLIHRVRHPHQHDDTPLRERIQPERHPVYSWHIHGGFIPHFHEFYDRAVDELESLEMSDDEVESIKSRLLSYHFHPIYASDHPIWEDLRSALRPHLQAVWTYVDAIAHFNPT